MNFYPFHIGDYISHTSHLTDAEDLAYRRMIDLYYQSEQPFTDVEFVARRIKSTPEIVSVLLSDFFVKTEDGWRNKRADIEITKYHAKAESARNANKKRWESEHNSKSDVKSDVKSDAELIPTKNQEPRTNNQEPNKDKATKVACPTDVDIQVWNDWLLLRKTKKASVTQTVISGARKEAEKANITLEDFLRIWCLRGSQGLEASWIKPEEKAGMKYQPDKMKNLWADIDSFGKSHLLGDK